MGTMVPRYHATMGTMVTIGTMVPRYHATTCTMGTIGTMPTTLPWYQGTMVPWYHEFRTLLGRPKADLSGGCGGRSPPLKKEKRMREFL